MKLKKNKYDIMNEIRSAAWAAINDPNNQSFGYDAKQKIEQAITMSITNAFEAMLRNIYTDEEFERDIGLKD